jgi:hypothetical protein
VEAMKRIDEALMRTYYPWDGYGVWEVQDELWERYQAAFDTLEVLLEEIDKTKTKYTRRVL